MLIFLDNKVSKAHICKHHKYREFIGMIDYANIQDASEVTKDFIQGYFVLLMQVSCKLT